MRISGHRSPFAVVKNARPSIVNVVGRSEASSRDVRVRVSSPTRPAVIGSGEKRNTATYTIEAWTAHHEGLRKEEAYWLESDEIEGTLPQDLAGTFFRNGPALNVLGGHRLHPFDGHGAIARVGIKEGKAHYAVKFVRTEAYLEESSKDAITYRGFGSKIPGSNPVEVLMKNFGEFRDKKVANTNVIEWGGKVLALWEGDRATQLDPITLETLEEESFGGAVAVGKPFTAHPHYDAESGRLVCYGSGPRTGEMNIWEIDQNSKVVMSKSLKFPPTPPYLHDFAVTKNWYIFYQAPLEVEPSKLAAYLLGFGANAECARFAAEKPGRWILIPRGREGEPKYIETPAQFTWHYSNAFEEDNGNVNVDCCVFDYFDLGGFNMLKPDTIPRGFLRRTTLNPTAGTATRVLLSEHPGDFPRINENFSTQPYRYSYMSAPAKPSDGFPFQAVIKCDVQNRTSEMYTAPYNCFLGETIYVPAVPAATSRNPQDEDRGYVLTLQYDGERDRSSLLVLDAKNIGAGPVAKIHMRRPVPFSFHCGYSPTVYQPAH